MEAIIEEIRKLREKYDNLKDKLENAPTAWAVKDEDGKIDYVTMNKELAENPVVKVKLLEEE